MPTLWDDPKKAAELYKRREILQEMWNSYKQLETQFQDFQDLFELACEDDDEPLQQEVYKGLKQLSIKAKKSRLELFFSQPEDRRACLLSVQAGSGGTEAQDWTAMLLRMYTRWAEQHGYKVELFDDSPGEEAGLKSATIKISGKQFPYGWLKGERGVHRLVRISPFDSASRRHTSFSSVTVSPEVDDLTEIDIQENDLKIDTYRASGAGGQHVNKTDSAIRITHIPTGIVVQCQQDRSQHRNRSIAMSMLKAKLYDLEKQKQEEAQNLERQDEKGISWGHQIRSYVLQPYRLVKDLRTEVQVGNPAAVLDGDIDPFLLAFLEANAREISID